MKRPAQALTAGVAAVAAAAVIATSGSAQAPATPTPLNLVMTAQKSVGFAPRHEPRPGDRVGFGGTISGDETGIARGICTVVDKVHVLCTVSAKLSKGSVSAQSLVRLDEQTSRYAVTGGTGAYNGARGTAVATAIDGTERSAVRITLLP